MKKLTRIMTSGIAAIMTVSAMGMSTFAKTVVPLEGGITMTIYGKGEAPTIPLISRDVDYEAFGHDVVKYPSSTPLQLKSTGKSALPIDSGQNTLRIEFDDDNEYESGYQGLYDITEGRYIGDLSGPYNLGETLEFTGLTGGHSYRIYFASDRGTVYTSGIVRSY